MNDRWDPMRDEWSWRSDPPPQKHGWVKHVCTAVVALAVIVALTVVRLYGH